jgi:hypothetical protein
MLMLISKVDVGKPPSKEKIYPECYQPASTAIFNQSLKLAAPLLGVPAVILITSFLCKHWLSDIPQNMIAVVEVSNVRWLRTAVVKTSWEAIRDNSIVKILTLGLQNCFPSNWVSCKSRAAFEPRVCVTIDGVLDWILDLLTTYTKSYDSDLQAITASPLVSTIHTSPQHPLSLFQLVVSSAVSW